MAIFAVGFTANVMMAEMSVVKPPPPQPVFSKSTVVSASVVKPALAAQEPVTPTPKNQATHQVLAPFVVIEVPVTKSVVKPALNPKH